MYRQHFPPVDENYHPQTPKPKAAGSAKTPKSNTPAPHTPEPKAAAAAAKTPATPGSRTKLKAFTDTGLHKTLSIKEINAELEDLRGFKIKGTGRQDMCGKKQYSGTGVAAGGAGTPSHNAMAQERDDIKAKMDANTRVKRRIEELTLMLKNAEWAAKKEQQSK